VVDRERPDVDSDETTVLKSSMHCCFVCSLNTCLNIQGIVQSLLVIFSVCSIQGLETIDNIYYSPHSKFITYFFVRMRR